MEESELYEALIDPNAECPHNLQKLHTQYLIETRKEMRAGFEMLAKKIDGYETIKLLNGDNNDDPFTMPRQTYIQRMYNGFKKTNKLERNVDRLEKDFVEHKSKTIGKELTKFGSFTKNVLQPIAWLVFVAFMIYSFLTNRSDFNRFDKLQKTIERTEQSK